MTATVFTPCRGKCIARHPCIVCHGHSAPHICRDPDCACHAPGNYGLLHCIRHGMAVYVRDELPAGVTVLEVAL